MTKKVKNSIINRELTFPIKVGSHNIIASPGDSVSSAFYYNKKQLSKKIKIYGKRDLIFSKKIRLMKQIKGIYAATLSIINDNLSLNVEKTIKHAEHLIQNGCHGVVFFGRKI